MTWFRLSDCAVVFTSDFGTLHLLLSEPESLPLYPDDDGFYSVNGPALHSNYSKYPTAHPLGSKTWGTGGQRLHTPSHPLQRPVDFVNESAILPRSSVPPSPPPSPSSPSPSSPETSPRRIYACQEPGCAWPSSFQTRQGLIRHHEARHLQKRLDCPFPGCKMIGNRGIKRKDNLRAHLWTRHGVKLPPESHTSYA
ncbi:hypothetical protein HOY80DRAFT_970526 [Tuber brumale]|nr:hypothetical protein HOY80DRAFT_970526 [Tuber brumale]